MNGKSSKALKLGGIAVAVALAYGLLASPHNLPQDAPLPNPLGNPAVAAEAPSVSVPAASTEDLQRPAVAQPLAAPAAAAAAPAAPAAVAPDKAQGRDARGLVRAVHEATLSAGMVAQIVKMPFAEGGAFKKGDLLVEFDCERPLAEQRAAAAAMQVEQKTVETNQELERFNSIGKFDLLISVSKLNKAKAELEALNAQIRQCKIVAPFTGRVIENKMHLFESASVSQPLLRIVDTSNLELDVIVPSQWLQWLRPGAAFSFKVDETGSVNQAVVDRLLPTVDPVSKTIKIIGRLGDASAAKTIPGMSGTASFRNTES
ncbi:HlyD family efflux transporter periplasmic adaptor subunit [Pseudomonas sp. HR96]|uniref:efflux RND transporter periplasmic adaptor subunit n=1 Tax=Pseudomonas sp. HR96 TaxID=1027966 RepID=UPI002A75A055|nr:HlyD family efflux transporter periplasmic adaptor subunit [Pseudomonas sp. HR96]WPO97714.1 HlyD family efflux transporter periplasmic adaptor subunit [Pseudomonas sp. HR96]